MLLPQQSWRNIELLYSPLKGIARDFTAQKIWIVAIGFVLCFVENHDYNILNYKWNSEHFHHRWNRNKDSNNTSNNY